MKQRVLATIRTIIAVPTFFLFTLANTVLLEGFKRIIKYSEEFRSVDIHALVCSKHIFALIDAGATSTSDEKRCRAMFDLVYIAVCIARRNARIGKVNVHQIRSYIVNARRTAKPFIQ